MNEELEGILSELHGITNNFNVVGEGVAGSLTEGYMVTFDAACSGPSDGPEGAEGPEGPNFPCGA